MFRPKAFHNEKITFNVSFLVIYSCFKADIVQYGALRLPDDKVLICNPVKLGRIFCRFLRKDDVTIWACRENYSLDSLDTGEINEL